MSDSEQDVPLVVWGFPVPTKSNGRKMWPREIKEMAAVKFAAGHTVAAIARDVMANESLVGKWVRQPRSDEPPGEGTPRISEIVGIVDAEDDIPSSTVRGTSCELQIGDVRLIISPGYPCAHLTEILRAVRASR